ncbi:hypothetical protein F2P81_001864 [Scophthalmus maximus]|uniref:Transmembrane protein n=1 Tax=Scophthalmus maximus TaxID=52904 RepID=A0A6A4TJE0_SCOMX|nr:hypothetical protein F2P81_001864 [Scophthalmus maximus]
MACADVDMDIQRTDEEPHRADSGEPTMVRRYQATEVLPDDKGPLHDLLQKQPSVLGFIIAGVVSNLLFKYPRLLPLSFAVNCGCIIVTVAAACLIGVDLAYGNPVDEPYWRIEVLALCVMGLEVFLSAILCFWFSKEKRDKAP